MFISLFTILLLIFFLIFYMKFSTKIPILMYHRIDTVQGDRNTLHPKKFEQQLEYLYNNGYTTIDMNQLYDYYVNNIKLPKKSVVLTFDDGYHDNLKNALPLLKKYKMKGNVFVISNWIGQENKWENFGKAPTRTMTETELKTWLNEGNYIGSHTTSHPFLSRCDVDNLTFELQNSKSTLEKITSNKIIALCYPYGDFDNKVIEIARLCNYKIGLAIFDNAPIWHFNLLALPRIPIPSGQKHWEFKLKVSKTHMIFVILRQFEKKIKKLFR